MSLGPRSASPKYVADAVVELAGITAEDRLLDIGCNDARVPVAVAARTGATAIGIEVDAAAVEAAHRHVAAEGMEGRVKVVHADAMACDISVATVVFLYLLPKGMQVLKQKLLDDLRPGTRVVSYMFRIPDWEALWERTVAVSSPDPARPDVSAVSKLHLYRLPATPAAPSPAAADAVDASGTPAGAAAPSSAVA